MDLFCGTGTIAQLLAQQSSRKVIGVDISPERVNLLNSRKSPIVDIEISTYLDDIPKDEILMDAFRYFQNRIGDKNENQRKLNQFIVDFLTILESEMSEDDKESDFIFSEIDTTEMENLLSKGDKNSIQHLKDKLLTHEKTNNISTWLYIN